MKSMLMRCIVCKRYTMGDRCPSCGASAERRAPARYSPQDRFGKYRRRLMRESGGAEGEKEAGEEPGKGAGMAKAPADEE